MKLTLFIIIISLVACSQRNKNESFKGSFDLGEVIFFTKSKEIGEKTELSLVARFELKKEGLSDDLSSYFQYELGKKINLVIDNDTLSPNLSYYVPIIKENQKEIDCKYILDKNSINKTMHVIINDNILGFNKINVLIK